MGNLNVVYFILFIGYFCQGVVSSRPKIKPAKNEYIIGSNTDFNLTCTGDEPITWTYPNVTLDGMFMSFISVSVRESAGIHYALLSINNASFVDTGFYYCHAISAPKNDRDKSTNIYIYVRDENHLKVLPKDVQDLYAPQNSNAILDCRPTSPDVTVTLENSNEEMVPCEFDPKIGFTLKRVSLLDSEQYTCKFVYKNISQEHIIILFVTTKPTAVEKPFIETSNNGRISVGQNLTLNCTITVEYQIYLNIEWKVPDEEGFKLGRITKNESIDLIKGDKACKSVLTVTNVSKKDAGKYICSVKDHVNNTSSEEKEITVLDIGESHISLNNTGMHEINETAGASIRWVIKIDAYPPVIQQIWRNNKGDEINQELKNQKYVMEQKTPDSISLKINYITLNDSGMYQFEVSNEIESKILNLTLNVLDKPAVEIETQNYHRSGEISQLQCFAAGNPLPTIEWWFKPCQNDSCKFLRISEKQYSLTQIGLQTVSTLNLTATVTGLVRCKGFNSIGNDSDTKGFYVTDVEEGFNIWGIDDTSLIALGDDIKINCAVSVYNYTNNLNWEIWKDNSFHPIIKNDRIYVERNTTDYTYRVSLTINSITHNDSANYACVARNLDNYKEFLNVTIIVNDPKKAKIINTNLNGTEKQIKAGEPVTLYCDASGIPVPNIIWKKDNLDWSIRENHSHIILSEDNKMLNFKYVDDDDTGEYSCKAENRLGSDTRKTRLLLMSNKSTWSTALLIIMIVLAIVFIGLVAVLVIKIKKEKKLRRELRIAGLQNFEKGALESLNPELGVDDQAELLPYDKKWEFPRDKLKLGKQLGSGAFGVVMKADAFGLVEGETVATVAVKMVKRNADYTYIKALASELKIMVHLGKHLNVVNLLGACTKNVTKRELLVIVEYCRYGNLHNYLFRHREDFVNQIDPKTGLIDVTIGEEILNRTMSSGSNHSRSRSLSAFAGVDYRLTPNPNSCNTESTTVCTPTGEDSLILSNNSVQPEWRSNYRGDYNKGNVKPISSSDLLCWAFQVARGMEYLASRKVLHGDLAARNILLAEDNIVKICDFGLAKSMYKSDNYKKKGDGPLPVKWMAVESIRDRVFSTQSDVWSYGIVLWEFFSLARTPYPGMDADERLYNKLVDGYRMDQPEFSTKEIYQIMMECWHAKPTYRPSFSKLAENLGFMLQESVRQHYIELNDPYIQMNNTLMEGHSDYLAMLSPPDYGNLSSPSHDYINQNPIPDSAADASASGYLPMDIFSPKPNASIFDFEVHKKQKNADDTATGTELLPILHTNESDGELSPTSPVRNISNPNYRNMTLDDDKCKIIEPKKEIVHNSDNYINMPQQKKALKNTDAFSNPSYIELNKKIEEETNANNYVNSQSRDWERL